MNIEIHSYRWRPILPFVISGVKILLAAFFILSLLGGIANVIEGADGLPGVLFSAFIVAILLGVTVALFSWLAGGSEIATYTIDGESIACRGDATRTIPWKKARSVRLVVDAPTNVGRWVVSIKVETDSDAITGWFVVKSETELLELRRAIENKGEWIVRSYYLLGSPNDDC